MSKYKKFLNSLNPKDAIIFYNESLKNHCSFHIGGRARFLVVVNNEKTLLEVLRRAKNKRVFILGAGTNILFKDKFFNGTIIKLGVDFKKIKIISSTKDCKLLTVGAGANLFELNYFLRKNDLSGLEWSFGIPGSIGGVTRMNSGAYGHEFGEFVQSVKILYNNKLYWTKNFSFSYRNSSFDKEIILAVKLKLFTGQKIKIESLQKEYMNRRIESQPYSEFSAGSVFKRIINNKELLYPAKIIDNLGLKGVRIGSAEVSTKHAGFIINKSDAKFRDVAKLIKLVKKRVKTSCGLELKEEIIIV